MKQKIRRNEQRRWGERNRRLGSTVRNEDLEKLKRSEGRMKKRKNKTRFASRRHTKESK